MLIRIRSLVLAFALAATSCVVGNIAASNAAYADGCPTAAYGSAGNYGGQVEIATGCPGRDGGSGSTAEQGHGPSKCWDRDGLEVECVVNGFSWTPSEQMWCVYGEGDPLWGWSPENGRWLRCVDSWGNVQHRRGLVPYAGPDPETLLREALDSVGLKQATFHIGAWPDNIKYPQYGIIWWVGAPLWLWIDKDPHVWGSHPLEASAGGTTITATVTSTSIVYTMGDGETVTCTDIGKERRNSPYEPMANESTCQHKYRHTNTLKDPTSRYTITAEVIWTVTWKTNDGHTGKFTVNVPAANTEQVHVGELRIVRR